MNERTLASKDADSQRVRAIQRHPEECVCDAAVDNLDLHRFVWDGSGERHLCVHRAQRQCMTHSIQCVQCGLLALLCATMAGLPQHTRSRRWHSLQRMCGIRDVHYVFFSGMIDQGIIADALTLPCTVDGCHTAWASEQAIVCRIAGDQHQRPRVR
jgi:hypothetical protein